MAIAASLLAGPARAGTDDAPIGPSGRPAWAEHATGEAMRLGAPGMTVEEPPPVIPKFARFPNSEGHLGTYQPNGATETADQPFFQPLGVNGRTCQTCHQPASAWTITPSLIRDAFKQTGGTAPIFRPVDGAVCPSADVSTPEKRESAYSLLLNKGLIRVFIPLPAGPALQFSIVDVTDPYGCNTDPAYGLTSYGPSAPTAGTVSVYRRPLPTTNMRFLTALMWDGREPSLESQATDAVRIHMQSPADPTPDQLAQIVGFESGLYSAQIVSAEAGRLNQDGAAGGPVALSREAFHVGINDVLGGDPSGAAFDRDAMTDYAAWEETGDPQGIRAMVARGEQIFNEKPIAITGVTGLNDQLGAATINGTCTTCHDTPNVGNHSVKLPINIGVVAPDAAELDTTGLPVFVLRCDSGPLAGQSFRVTDPGKALVSGACADIGKMKGPILRGLAARAPYFHNGAAPDLDHVVDFYNARFGIGLSNEERAALIAFLRKL
ncbi:MAG: hypothetical protein JOZ42_05870 [Acetobacteraceae bacterium]|nr:hypothetical protein [Acetobacteraceae bacterium]